MLHPRHLRDLTVDSAAHPRGQPHLSSASGLAQAGRFLYLVADDEQHLGVLDTQAAAAPIALHRMLPGDLPPGKAQRKAIKRDFEALATLPADARWPHGALLALGSGSTAQRERAVLLPLQEDGSPAGPADTLDLAPLYQPLRTRFADLNIEGAFVADGRLHLLQRANQGSAVNACIAYDLREFIAWTSSRQRSAPDARITPFELGAIDGVPYGFTDGAPIPGGGWIFSAVAEDTQDSYADGRCAGSALGWVSAQGELQEMQPLAGAPKVEGIVLDAAGRLLMVTDADDPARASQLLELRWPFRPCISSGISAASSRAR